MVNLLSQQPSALPVDISKGFDDSADVAAVLKSLGTLDPLDQEIVGLAAFEGLSHEEIGIVVNKRSTTVNSRLYRARKQLRLALDDHRDTENKNNNPTPSQNSVQRRMP